MKLSQNTVILVLSAVILSGWLVDDEIIKNSHNHIIQTQQKQIFQIISPLQDQSEVEILLISKLTVRLFLN